MNVAERLKALAEGKKIRHKGFAKDDFIHLHDGYLRYADGESYEGLRLTLVNDNWELYQEPQGGYWVVFYSTHVEAYLTNPGSRPGAIRIEHVRVELPNTQQAAINAAWIDKQGTAYIPTALPKHTREMWVNVYPGRIGGQLHDSSSKADECAAINRIACVKVRVEYTDGEGL